MKTNSFWQNCNNIPDESCLQKKSLSVTIIRNKICLFFFLQKHVIPSVEMAVFEINDDKPVINYIPWFLISINSLRICSTIFVFKWPQSGHLQHWFFIADSNSNLFYVRQNEPSYEPWYSAFAGSGSLLLMRGFQIFAKRKWNFFFTIIKHYHSPK